jgi:protein-disulfide isomerase
MSAALWSRFVCRWLLAARRARVPAGMRVWRRPEFRCLLRAGLAYADLVRGPPGQPIRHFRGLNMQLSRAAAIADRVTSFAIALCAMVVVIAIARREFFGTQAAKAQDASGVRPPRVIAEWAEVLATARQPYDSAALLTVVTFFDAECPFCRRYEASLRAWRNQMGPRVTLLAVHFPLPQHRFARPAARALECARVQGRFDPMLAHVFASQDSLGLRPWDDIASDAGVSRLQDFRECVRAAGPIPGVEEGVSLGIRLGISGTPAVIVNGRLYWSPPDTGELTRLASAAGLFAASSGH